MSMDTIQNCEKLELGHFAELVRMLKYIDRNDDDEIRAVTQIEGEKEMKRAEEDLKRAEENIPDT